MRRIGVGDVRMWESMMVRISGGEEIEGARSRVVVGFVAEAVTSD